MGGPCDGFSFRGGTVVVHATRNGNGGVERVTYMVAPSTRQISTCPCGICLQRFS